MPRVWLALVAASIGSSQSVSPELSVLVQKAQLQLPVVSSCRGEFRAGRSRAYAVAVSSASAGGRYLVLESDATVLELAAFTGRPDLACYTPAAARKLNRDISRSATINGQIAPRWRTTVVCAFVNDTSAVCWQYSPTDRMFVKVGAWVT